MQDCVKIAADLAERLRQVRASAFPLLIAEAGARKPPGREGGFERCYALPHRRILAFEADEVEAVRLQAAFTDQADVEVVAAGLGAVSGPARLYLTKARQCSSLYPPDSAVISRYHGIEAVAAEQEVDISLTTLAEVTQARGWRGFDFLKLDVQGAELQVLDGAGAVLDGVSAILTEVSFIPLYRGQPLLWDVQRFLSSRGFELYQFVNLGRLSRTGAPGAQVSWGDALFLRPPEDVSGDAAVRLAVFAALYGAHDIAEVALRRVEGAEAVLAWFSRAVRPEAAPLASSVRRTRRMVRAVGRLLLQTAGRA